MKGYSRVRPGVISQLRAFTPLGILYTDRSLDSLDLDIGLDVFTTYNKIKAAYNPAKHVSVACSCTRTHVVRTFFMLSFSLSLFLSFSLSHFCFHAFLPVNRNMADLSPGSSVAIVRGSYQGLRCRVLSNTPCKVRVRLETAQVHTTEHDDTASTPSTHFSLFL